MKNIIKITLLFSFFGTLFFLNTGCTPTEEVKEKAKVEASHSHDNGTAHSHSHGGKTHTHGAPSFTYLKMNGDFKMNLNDSMTQNDPRNPSRLTLSTTTKAGSLTRMTFYDHNDIEKKLAECGYEFIGSRPDPHYYPKESKTSIWDVFEKKEDYDGDCSNYKFVLSRSPHGDPIHMHLRYGNDVDSILALSNAEYDSQFNPWWATYCDIERTTSCD